MHACINIILTKLHVIQLRNKSCNWIFFQNSNQKTAAYFQHHSHINCILFRQEFKSCKLKNFPGFQLIKIIGISTIFHTKKKTTCYQPRIRHANWIFFSSFLTRKRHAYFQHHSHINCMLFRQEFKSCKLKKFPGFQLRETICISTIFHTKKNACYQPRIRHAN